MTLNIENLTKLKQWLEAGAPEATFDMTRGLAVNDCRTTCCMGGAAYQMSISKDGNFPTLEEIRDSLVHNDQDNIGEFCWDEIREGALNWLGLTSGALFESYSAPPGCTPQQAAEAVQNVIEGRPPWS